MSARGQFDLVGHNLIRYEEFSPGSLAAADSVIIPPEDPGDEWTRVLMHMIGEWRAVLRSTYIRWAMAINGLHVAAAKYKSETLAKEFVVTSIRVDRSGADRTEVIAKYSFQEASEAHLRVQGMLCAHGFIDLYAGLEEMVFGFYRAYLLEKPDILMRGPAFDSLRKLHRASSGSEESRAAWNKALIKRLYDGLNKVFLAFCQNAGLQTPSGYTETSIESWADPIAGISLMRNLLIHGETTVPQELADFCEKPYSLGFSFDAGKPLRLSLLHLQLLEAFSDQLLTALNFSFVERASPALRKQAAKHFKGKKTQND